MVSAAAAALAFAAYLATMNRTYGFIDKGELAAVATTLGIAHPTGYPTLTLLGYIVTRLSPLRPVLSLNILAALLTAAGVGLMTLLFGRLLELVEKGSWLPKRGETRKDVRQGRRRKGTAGSALATPAESTSLRSLDRLLLAAVSALFAGFTTTWWSQATGFEVYGGGRKK